MREIKKVKRIGKISIEKTGKDSPVWEMGRREGKIDNYGSHKSKTLLVIPVLTHLSPLSPSALEFILFKITSQTLA